MEAIEPNAISLLEHQLATQVEKWFGMPGGASEAQIAAESYYLEHIFPLTLQLFRQRERPKLKDQDVFGMILTVGTSPEPLILSVSACRPQRVLFLHTPQTEKYLDKIIEMTGLKVSQIDKRTVQGTDPLVIYQAVFQTWESWGRRKNVAVDITGGTKSMTSGLAMAGALLGFQLIYVATDDFLSERRRPRPGSEYLEILPNPYIVFGVLQEKEAEELFKRQDYHGASKTLAELAEKVPDPRRFAVLLSLSRAYEEWDALNLKEAVQQFEKVLIQIKKLTSASTGSKFQNLVELHKEKLKHLAKLMSNKPRESILPLLQNSGAVEALVCTIYYNAERMAGRGKFDAASLYLYRLLELFEQRRFARYGIDTAFPAYSLLPSFVQGSLLHKLNWIRESIKYPSLEELPPVIALTDGYMLLEAAGDQFQLNQAQPKPIHWAWFTNEIQKRNYSILAHGFIFVTEAQYLSFKEMVDRVFALFCLVEAIDKEVALRQYQFIENPFEQQLF